MLLGRAAGSVDNEGAMLGLEEGLLLSEGK